ncbi:hypothetical protein D3C72_2488760 [compost metagenome]
MEPTTVRSMLLFDDWTGAALPLVGSRAKAVEAPASEATTAVMAMKVFMVVFLF